MKSSQRNAVVAVAAEGATLAGRRAWIITDGKPGMDVQCRGVADALGLDYQMKRVAPDGFHRFAAPYGGVAGREAFGRSGSQFAPPWPEIAMATGRLSIPYIRALRRAAGNACYRVVLQDPKTGRNTADLIWVPQHDKRRGSNVITTLTAPHSFSQRRLAELRADLPGNIGALRSPRVTIVLGGKNSVYSFSQADDARLHKAVKSMAALGASFMITSSRRTHKGLLDGVLAATANCPRLVYDGEAAAAKQTAVCNPYPQFLAAADILVVTADSVNMTGEAAASGQPVYVFHPTGGSAKFNRFHDGLRHYGATRDLPEQVTQIADWSYAPLDSARDIADEVTRHWRQWRRNPAAGL